MVTVSSSKPNSGSKHEFGFRGPMREGEKYQLLLDRVIKQAERLSLQLSLMIPKRDSAGDRINATQLYETDNVPGGMRRMSPEELDTVVRQFIRDIGALKTQSGSWHELKQSVTNFIYAMSHEPIVREYKHWPSIQAELAELIAVSANLERESVESKNSAIELSVLERAKNEGFQKIYIDYLEKLSASTLSDRMSNPSGEGRSLLDEGYKLLADIENMPLDKDWVNAWSVTLVQFLNRVSKSGLGPKPATPDGLMLEVVLIQAFLKMMKTEV
jgi:hypothetical protein